ncbi:MAG: CTP synthase, partial [candidate division Zixibacteria bacterium]|nr:CTP synthase [candidate division Zixibacteria bacterium]
LFTNVPGRQVVQALDVGTIYEVPLLFHAEGFDQMAADHLGLGLPSPFLTDWEKMVEKIKNPPHRIKIAICGKYVNLKDAYKSIIESFVHAGAENDCKVELSWVSSEAVKRDGAEKYLSKADGLLIPGGFGERGVEGKIEAIQYVRENKIPFFGICLGMQCATIEFARQMAGLEGANSTEFNTECEYPVIALLPEQAKVTQMGGTMRLGAYPAKLTPGSHAAKAYGTAEISERHRHRYEFNNEYRKLLEDAGFKITGISPDNRLVEIIELNDHPWFVGVQFHPELKSRPGAAHPLFREFVRAALRYRLAEEETAPFKQEEEPAEKSRKDASEFLF